jgi:integrase/recombinase XerD
VKKWSHRKLDADSLMLPQTKYSVESLRGSMGAHLESMAVLNHTMATRRGRAGLLLRFAKWCEERGIMKANEVTKNMLERYQRSLFFLRKKDGKPLSVLSQIKLVSAVKQYFRWCARQNIIEANPAADLEMPRAGMSLPRYTLSPAEVERVLQQPNLKTLAGIRDRAMLEVLWATGIRRTEICKLSIFDVREDTETVFVRHGKGNKDRVVPVSPRAISWVKRYLEEVRPNLAMSKDAGTLFLSPEGEEFSPDVLSQLVTRYIKATKLPVKGSCHLLRHACATAMLEGGADVRFVQELLGHVSMETTQIYTRVSISKLKQVYASSHPSAGVAAVMDVLDAEESEEIA